MDEQMQELLYKHSKLKDDLRHVEGQMADIVMTYQGSVIDAIRDGLVRFNFPVPQGLRRAIKEGKI